MGGGNSDPKQPPLRDNGSKEERGGGVVEILQEVLLETYTWSGRRCSRATGVGLYWLGERHLQALVVGAVPSDAGSFLWLLVLAYLGFGAEGFQWRRGHWDRERGRQWS
jgi:hypothetical protein